VSTGKVVDEKSACIDGHRNEQLHTNHFEINKYYGHDDPSYRKVYPVIVEMTKNAVEKVHDRLHRTCIMPHEASYAYTF
jgi:hypothetical protein